jgi:hypothetical protein
MGGFLSVGSNWVPSNELWISAGPTFDANRRGASIGFGGRYSIFTIEMRAGAHDSGAGEVLLLLGLTDLHGLFKLGPPRTDVSFVD